MPDGWGRSYRLALHRVGSALSQGLSAGVGIRIERRSIFDVPSAGVLDKHFSLARLRHVFVTIWWRASR